MNILFAPLRRALLKLFNFSFNSSLFWVSLGKFFRILSVQNSSELCKVKRAKVLWEEAERRGIYMEELLLFKKPFDVYVAKKNTTIVFSGLPRPKNISKEALDSMDDKGLLKVKLQANGLPVPAGRSVWNFIQAKKIFRAITTGSNKYVIIKPRAGSRGRHSTTFISTESSLKHAYKVAKQLCFWVMVEEQIMGPVYRATVINYELCGVLKGEPPQVEGDGVLNLKELLIRKNHGRPAGVEEIKNFSEVECFVKKTLELKSGQVWNFVPKKGQVVILSEKIGVAYGGSSAEEINVCHPENKELFVKAARVVNDPIVGFDFIIPDITKSWKDQVCGFLEANSLPFIHLHHQPLQGPKQNVAAKVWDMMENIKN
ncbi:MAG: hypothetical protein JNN11_05255 [Candidatus Doudnabacteria bacterium]|nr:hypothetical protein [Candidatus Doudnabacteria bacterium]